MVHVTIIVSFIFPSFCFLAFFSLGLGFLFIWVSLDVYVYSVFNETGSYLHAKNQLDHLLFLRYCAKKQQINILGNLAMPGSTHLKWQYHLGEIWCLSPGYLFNLILHVFVEILLRYCKLVMLGTLGIPGYAHPKWHYQLDWPTTFWPITQEPESCQIGDWWWNIISNISFHFRLFPGKTSNKIFQEIQKTLF